MRAAHKRRRAEVMQAAQVGLFGSTFGPRAREERTAPNLSGPTNKRTSEHPGAEPFDGRTLTPPGANIPRQPPRPTRGGDSDSYTVLDFFGTYVVKYICGNFVEKAMGSLLRSGVV